MNYTQHYQLPQWVDSDRILRTDFNDMTGKIDAALKSNADALSAETAANAAAHAGFGNCRIYTASYVGDEGPGFRVLTFPKEPLAVLILGGDSCGIVALRGVTRVAVIGTNSAFLYITWSGNELSWPNESYGSIRLNDAGTTYCVVALIAA